MKEIQKLIKNKSKFTIINKRFDKLIINRKLKSLKKIKILKIY
jgi:hypothetical protein